MLILGVETSCDETAVALVEASGGSKKPRFRILTNIISSQVKLHKKFGGVVPNLAKREHQQNLVYVLKRAIKAIPLATAKKTPNPTISTVEKTLEREPKLLEKFKKGILPLRPPKIDLVAVTIGPGLEPALWVGVNFARALSYLWQKPLIGVNHLEGHIYSNWIEPTKTISKHKFLISKPGHRNRCIEFPAVCLIVSGGHTELVLMQSPGKYRLLGATRDDAVGEAYDKVARLLGLGYPGGPAIDRIAGQWKPKARNPKSEIKLPRPMLNSKDYDFSFAGLKTAVLYLVRDIKNAGKRVPIKPICAEFQQAVVDVLVAKTMRAAKEYKAKTIMVSGGVSANTGLRKAFSSNNLTTVNRELIPVLFPPRELTTDNAAMIAMAGYFSWMAGKRKNARNLTPNPNLEIL